MKSFLFLIIINIFHNLLIKSQDCSDKYSDCFNCSVCGEEVGNTCNCHWNKNSCKNGKDYYLSLDFYKYFNYCNDENSKTISIKYCGQSELQLNDKNEINLIIPKNDGIYGTSKLYCEYKYSALDKKDIFYTVKYKCKDFFSKYFNNIFLYLIITFNDETTASGYLSLKEIEREFDNIKEKKMLLYFSKGIESLPFSLTMKRNGDKTKLALYITIGIIILACLLCALIIYYLSKKMAENARLRQRTLLELAMAHQRAQYNIGEDRESSGSSEVDMTEENRKKIEILLKTTLAPKKINKKSGIKDGNICSICLEECKTKKNNISVTSCQHVFHYKCLSNWLIHNVLNPKCPNCNYNLLLDIENQKHENIQTIDVARRTNETNNLETQDGNHNLDTNENRFIMRNASRTRSRITNINRQNNNNNTIENWGNFNEAQEVIVENI